MKVLIVGYAGHGKDTLASILKETFNLKFESTSMYIAEKVIYPKSMDIFKSPLDCYNQKQYYRQFWKETIDEYNTPNKALLVKEILLFNDIYVGLRDKDQLDFCKKENLFDLIIGIYNRNGIKEEIESCNIDPLEVADIVIFNDGKNLSLLKEKVMKLEKLFK